MVPEYEALAKKLSGFKSLVIAKVDSTENEVQNVAISGFPTFKFFTADHQIVDYDSGRTAADMEKWLIEKIDGLKEHLASLQQEEEVKEDVQAVEDKTEEAKEEL